eukprot:4353768-Pyramimonas_sp.AAC.1
MTRQKSPRQSTSAPDVLRGQRWRKVTRDARCQLPYSLGMSLFAMMAATGWAYTNNEPRECGFLEGLQHCVVADRRADSRHCSARPPDGGDLHIDLDFQRGRFVPGDELVA